MPTTTVSLRFLVLPSQYLNDTCAWTSNNAFMSRLMCKKKIHFLLEVPKLRLTTSNPGIRAIGSWAKYLGLGTQAEADVEQSCERGYWRLG